jgi:hypothetical protein
MYLQITQPPELPISGFFCRYLAEKTLKVLIQIYMLEAKDKKRGSQDCMERQADHIQVAKDGFN